MDANYTELTDGVMMCTRSCWKTDAGVHAECCVHVPRSQLVWLYSQVTVGLRVVNDVFTGRECCVRRSYCGRSECCCVHRSYCRCSECCCVHRFHCRCNECCVHISHGWCEWVHMSVVEEESVGTRVVGCYTEWGCWKRCGRRVN